MIAGDLAATASAGWDGADRAALHSQAVSASAEQATAHGPAQGRIPDFFVVGHGKSGTTALYEMLSSHPQIFMPVSKEPWFFASELHVRTPPRPEGTPRTLDEYMSLFSAAEPGQRVGEASSLYLWSRTAASAIAAAQPGARIVAFLREPASFLRSLHLQFVETYVETESDFRKAMSLESARRSGNHIPRYTYWPDALLYSEHVHYVEQLSRFRAVFAAEQMLVLIYDDFRRDNQATLRKVLRFLEVDEHAQIELREANPSVQVRSQHLHQFIHALSVGRGPVSKAVKGAIKSVTPRSLRRDVVRSARRGLVYRDPQPPDELFMRQLRQRFKPEVVALSEYLDRDLITLWGYEGIP
jgi:hypothetical protein